MIGLLVGLIMVWERPIHTAPDDHPDAVWSTFVCRGALPDKMVGCFAYGEPTTGYKAMGACQPERIAQARIDFPQDWPVCAWVYRRELDAPIGLKP